jgi:hypothetical protein
MDCLLFQVGLLRRLCPRLQFTIELVDAFFNDFHVSSMFLCEPSYFCICEATFQEHLLSELCSFPLAPWEPAREMPDFVCNPECEIVVVISRQDKETLLEDWPL